MPNGKGALADAVRGAVNDDDATAEEAEGTSEETADSTASVEQAAENDQEQGSEDDTSEAPEGTEEFPDTYFGLDLSALSQEQRANIVGELRKRDDHIGKLLRERVPGETAETEPSVETEEAPEELTDEAILQALGLDPENPMQEDAIRVALPLVKKQVAQDQQLSTLMETLELQEIDRTWRQALSGMEREFGTLPTELDHDSVMQYAAENGITNPMDAYWRIVGPGRAALQEAITKTSAAKKASTETNAAKKAASTTRPASTDADDDSPVEGKNVKEATAEAAKRIMAQLGL